jgi:hypothetical protein
VHGGSVRHQRRPGNRAAIWRGLAAPRPAPSPSRGAPF